MSNYTLKNVSEVTDMAADFGLSELGEARFLNNELDLEKTGGAYHRLKPGKRQGFGHRHEEAEEVHVVLSGSGKVRIEDDEVELSPKDVLRIAPTAARRFEAGPDGLEYLVFGSRHKGDGELLHDFWAG